MVDIYEKLELIKEEVIKLKSTHCRNCGMACHGPLAEHDFYIVSGKDKIIADLKAELSNLKSEKDLTDQ